MKKDVEQLLKNLRKKGIESRDYLVIELHGMIEKEEQNIAFEEHPIVRVKEFKRQDREGAEEINMIEGFKTKIILSNRIAESSITINGVTVVIDSGTSKEIYYDPIRKSTIHKTDKISRAQAQ